MKIKNIYSMVLLLCLFLNISACSNNVPDEGLYVPVFEGDEKYNSTDEPDREISVPIEENFEKITIMNPGSFSEDSCKSRGLYDKVVMLESKYCGHCKEALPVFKRICDENGIKPIILDVSLPDQREQMESYGVQIGYTPTFIFGCDYYVGSMDEDDYIFLLKKFKGRDKN